MPTLQPRVLDDGDLLAVFNERTGMVRLNVSRGVDGWQVVQRWVTRDVKPAFNDVVTAGNVLYGFDRDI
ncbi:MAG TPA: hypothetical protein PJ982_19085, partial [Lacipirellulaceae bacterium]|nr:hypothetical protein [Lacipirellulaceae bacterium]